MKLKGYKSSWPNIFKALVLRFTIARYGRNNIGFMWTFAEPLVLCLGVMVIWSFTKGRYEHGLDLVAFVFTGYMPLTLWRHLTGTMVNVLRFVKFLTIFRGVTLFDILIVRLITEYIAVSGSALIVFVVLFSFGVLSVPHDFLLMLQGWIVMGLLGASFGFLVAAASECTEIIERVMQPFQYFLIPLCGCFYMVEWLPDAVKPYAIYVPTVHSYEMIRMGYFGPTIIAHYEMVYPICFSLVMAGLGFFLFERVKDHVEA